jgi:DNA processing protein
MEKDSLIKWLKLCTVFGLGPKKIMKLFEYFGNLETIYSASDSELSRVKIFNEKMLVEWNRLKNAQSEKYESIIDTCQKEKIVILPLFSDEYPSTLKYISNSPKNLFLKGNIGLLYTKKAAIVGSRTSDENAESWAYTISKKLAEKEITIISGGAEGIDYAAHKGALSAGGNTIWIFGTGLLRYYPEDHRELYEEIAKKGLLVSEHLPHFTGGRIALLNRNRITSALSNALIQVTSDKTGGSVTQMKIAIEQRIPIFCPKKELGFQPFEGILEEMKNNKIIEIEDAEPIMKLLDHDSESKQLKVPHGKA